MREHEKDIWIVKVWNGLMRVYNVGMLRFKDGFGYLVIVTVCQFVNSLFRDLGSIVLGLISEEDLQKGEEIQL
jgi:hypothetical protein